MERIAIFYGMDNHEQLKLFKLSVLSLFRNNWSKDIDLIIGLPNNNNFYNEVTSFLKRNNFIKFRIEFFNNDLSPKFYWLTCLIKLINLYEFVVQIDNDTLININLPRYIKHRSSDFSVFNGIDESQHLIGGQWRKTIDAFEGYDKGKIYINTGVVIIDSYQFKKNEININEEKVLDFQKICLSTNNFISDQAFLYVNYGQYVGLINNRLNLMLYKINYWTIINLYNRSILHYTYAYNDNGNWKKIDFFKHLNPFKPTLETEEDYEIFKINFKPAVIKIKWINRLYSKILIKILINKFKKVSHYYNEMYNN